MPVFCWVHYLKMRFRKKTVVPSPTSSDNSPWHLA
uniref:Uncharacterized protein n=1 Tax=Anguilla anguilla TaxID=7936 RepID=A0A0E9VJS1_ANGAN